jgi:CheY-like chemotaxis protein
MRLSGSETILIVDDDPAVLEMVGEALNPLGYNVLSAPSGEEALELLTGEQKIVDLLLTDVVLPGIKGQDLAHYLLQESPEVKVLFMSGFLCPSMAYDTQLKGFEAFIQKPFTPNELLQKLRKILGHKVRSQTKGTGLKSVPE